MIWIASHRRRLSVRLLFSFGLCVTSCCLSMQELHAQFAVGGVYIDPDGVLRETAALPANARLDLLRRQLPEPAPANVQVPSKLRKISLRRLESVLKTLRSEGTELPSDVQHLAGLHAARYVFFFPPTEKHPADVVIAGPAEGWTLADSGEVVGIRSRAPVLHLDDLLVTLRFAFGAAEQGAFLGCSIEPTQQGLKNYVSYFNSIGTIDRNRLPEIFGGMERAVGLQDIKVFGVPGMSRAALTMVAADYRLKRIAMGHDPSPVKQVSSYLDLAARRLQNISGAQPQHRWWFSAEFDAIRYSEDRLAYELEGQGLKVETAPSLPQLGGNATKPTRTAAQFTTNFTKNLPKLEEQIPVFSELRNLVELSVITALVRHQAQEHEGFWMPTFLLDDEQLPLASYAVPTQTPSLASYRLVKGKSWLISVSGGVEIQPRLFVEPERQQPASGPLLQETRNSLRLPVEPTQWWWD